MISFALSDSGQAPSAPPVPSTPKAKGTPLQPWVRFAARYVDMALGMLLLGSFLALIKPSVMDSEPSALLIGVMLFLCIFLNTGCLAAWGTTPGKWLAAIRVRDQAGQKPPSKRALHREALAWVKGLGCGLPFFTLVCLVMSYLQLKEEGVTAWDAKTGLVVSHERLAWWRVIALIVALASVTLGPFLLD